MPRITSTGWNAVPAELRLKIYRASWGSRTVAIRTLRTVVISTPSSETPDGSKAPHRQTTPLPVTLHLCFEARQETLKHYVTYLDSSKLHSPKLRSFNPNLDILHLGSRDLPPFDPLPLNPTAFLPASITVTLGPQDQYRAPTWATLRLDVSPILHAIKSIDFWILDDHDDEGSWSRRFRICRTKTVKKTPIAVFEDAVWRPVGTGSWFECQEKGFKRPGELWRWGYSREESRPRTKKMPDTLQVEILWRLRSLALIRC